MNVFRDFHRWILVSGVLIALSSVECYPMSSKAAGWMTSVGEEERSYSHIAGGSKFSKDKAVFSQNQPPRPSYQTRSASGSTSNRTLAAILVLTVLGVGATALLALICSRMGKKEKYDSMKGTVY